MNNSEIHPPHKHPFGTRTIMDLYQPLMLFYRGQGLQLLSELKGKRIAIGPEGSGTQKFALAVLALSGIKPGDGSAQLLDWEHA